MKTLPHSFRFAPVALLLAGVPLAAEDISPDDRTPPPPEDSPAAAPDPASRHAQSARVLLGQDVENSAGKGLGEVKDLLVDPKQGEIVFAIIETGGLLGVGEETRAVPFAALQQAADGSRNLILDIERDRWSQAPALGADHVDALADRNVAHDVVAFYRDSLDREIPAASSATRERLARVSEILGRKVEREGEEVGVVRDVIVHFDSRRASALLDPDDDFADTDRQFLVNFAQLTPAGKDRLTTTLTPDELSRAAPAEDRWWTATEGFPYWWGGYGGFGGAAHVMASSDLRTQAALAAGELEGRPSVDAIRERLRSDSDLSARAHLATVERDGNRLILQGLVDSHEARNEVGRRVSEIADGWEVVNRLDVRTATE